MGHVEPYEPDDMVHICKVLVIEHSFSTEILFNLFAVLNSSCLELSIDIKIVEIDREKPIICHLTLHNPLIQS